MNTAEVTALVTLQTCVSDVPATLTGMLGYFLTPWRRIFFE
jgi:hypothetical protein